MRKQWVLPIGILAISWLTACDNNNSTTTTTDSTGTTLTATTGGVSTGGRHVISETETYTDLKSGKSFKIKHDAASGRYVAESGEDLSQMFYLSPVTHDTFYGATGRWVNNALNYDPNAGVYTVDEDRWNQMNAETNSTMQGESESGTMPEADKVKSTEDEYKAKSADGSDKVKTNENETKVKSGDAKIKSNENETKVKTSTTKAKANENEVKIKQKTH